MKESEIFSKKTEKMRVRVDSRTDKNAEKGRFFVERVRLTGKSEKEVFETAS